MIVRVCVADEKPTYVFGIEGVEAEKIGAGGVVPVACNTTVCGLSSAVSAKTISAVLVPAALGEKE